MVIVNWKANRLAMRQGSLFPLCASTIAGAVIMTPVLVVLWRSFTTGKLGFNVGLNLANYMRGFSDTDILPMLSNSLIYAAGSALLGTCLGALLAWIVARTNTPGKALVELLPLYPLLMPPIMKNIGSRTTSKKMKKRIRSWATNVPIMPVSSSRISARNAFGLCGSGKWFQE